MPSTRSFRELVQRRGAADPKPQGSSQGAAKMTKYANDDLPAIPMPRYHDLREGRRPDQSRHRPAGPSGIAADSGKWQARPRVAPSADLLEKGREVAAMPQLRDAQFDRTRAGLPVAVTVAVALVAPLRAALAVPAPHRASLSNSIRRWAAKPIISRRNVASEPFSRSVRRAILSSVIAMILRSELRAQPNPTQDRHGGR
jgi:hypothetical protein